MKKMTSGCFLIIFLGFFQATIAQSFKIENNQLVVPDPIVFETGTAKIKPESESALNHVKTYLETKTFISLLRIEGHTDNQGNKEKNQKLSEQRALAIAKWLINKGIDCKRLVAVGFGDTKPIAENATPEGRNQNRRTVFVNAALRGRSIGGMPTDGGGKVAGDSCGK
jgi:OOP family OmpA-OmpF porin